MDPGHNPITERSSGKAKTAVMVSGWLQANARFCKSVWPGQHYRGNCQKCCIPLQKVHSFWEGLRNGIEFSFSCWCCIWKGGWGSLSTEKAKGEVCPLKKQRPFFPASGLLCFPSEMRGRSWADFSLSCGSSGEEQSGCYIGSLELLFQVDTGFFGVKRSNPPPSSQALHRAALRRWGKMIWCGVGYHM